MKTILVVDDNRNQLSLYVHELSLEGYNVITATTGHEALKKIHEYVPDLVVLDMILPDMDGIELIDSILTARCMTRIIVNTAYNGYKNNFMTWLADAYISKSSDLKELKDKVTELLGK